MKEKQRRNVDLGIIFTSLEKTDILKGLKMGMNCI